MLSFEMIESIFDHISALNMNRVVRYRLFLQNDNRHNCRTVSGAIAIVLKRVLCDSANCTATNNVIARLARWRTATGIRIDVREVSRGRVCPRRKRMDRLPALFAVIRRQSVPLRGNHWRAVVVYTTPRVTTLDAGPRTAHKNAHVISKVVHSRRKL